MSARYRNVSSPGAAPTYVKEYGCFGFSAPRCLPLDVTGDGDVELLVENTDGISREIVDAMSGTVEYPSVAAGEWDVTKETSIFDLDNDGYPELVKTGARGYWDYDPGGDTWSWVSQVFTASLAEGVSHQVVLDYDSDGDQDLWTGLCGYQASEMMTVVISENNGDGTFTDHLVDYGLECTEYHTGYANTLAGDLNLDGLPDIVYCGESHTQNVTVLVNNGSGFTLDSGIDFGGTQLNNIGKPWCGLGDYDQDGRLDLVKTHEETSIGLFRNITDTDNTWMIVRVQGATGDGLHSKIYFRDSLTNNIISSYEVGAFNIRQQNMIVHAGLGQRSSVDVEVCWPHGSGCELHQDVASNQVLHATVGSLN